MANYNLTYTGAQIQAFLDKIVGTTSPIQPQLDVRNIHNWIINGQFDVWQRGTSFIPADAGYWADRWCMLRNGSGGTFALNQQAFTIGQTTVPNNPTYFSRYQYSVAPSGQTYNLITQRIEDVTKLSDKTTSLSFWAKADTNRTITVAFDKNYGSGGSSTDYSVSSSLVNLTTSWQRFTAILSIPSSSGKTIGIGNYLALNFVAPNNSTFTIDISNVCLVEGSVAVECPAEPYAEVLRECQRYYQRFGGDSVWNSLRAFGIASSTTNVQAIIPLYVQLRIAPSAIEISNIAVGDGVTNTAVTGATMAQTSKDCIMFNAIVASGLTQYRQYQVLANNNLAGYLAFSAEL